MLRGWLVLAAGCGRIGFDGLASGTISDAIASDAKSMLDPDGAAQLGDALATVGDCAALVTLETFSNGTLAPEWTVIQHPQVVASETAGRLVFTFASPASSQAVARVDSAPFDARGRCVTADVPVIPADQDGALDFDVVGAAGHVRIVATGGRIGGSVVPPTVFPPLIAYDPVAHARWRIQFGNGRVVALTLDSSDTPTAVLLDVPTFLDESNLFVRFQGRVVMGSVNGGTAEVEEVSY